MKAKTTLYIILFFISSSIISAKESSSKSHSFPDLNSVKNHLSFFYHKDTKTLRNFDEKLSSLSLRDFEANMSEKDSLYFQDIINNSFQQFFDVVATERHIDRERLKEIANGRVFTGSQALELGLVDKLGTFDDAVKYAADLVGIEGDPPLVRERRRKGFFTYVIEGLTHSEFDDIKQEVKEEYIDAPLLQYKFVK